MRAVKRAAEVRLENLLPVVDGHLGNRREVSHAGIVDEDIETPEPAHRGVDGCGRLLGPSHIRTEYVDSVARGAVPRFGAARAAASRADAERPVMRTRAPPATSARAMPLPMPREPPVITAIRPASVMASGIVSRVSNGNQRRV